MVTGNTGGEVNLITDTSLTGSGNAADPLKLNIQHTAALSGLGTTLALLDIVRVDGTQY
jgi:hypothetical protein